VTKNGVHQAFRALSYSLVTEAEHAEASVATQQATNFDFEVIIQLHSIEPSRMSWMVDHGGSIAGSHA
jgi:hypothetical protein